MNTHDYRKKISQSISADQIVGERLRDDPLLDFIESQMIKVGSLSHAQVQWQEVENSALKLLSEKTKDLKILTILLQCLQHQNNAENFIVSLQILADFIALFWQSCYPAPGKRGVLPRRKFFAQIIQRSYQSAEKLEASQFDYEQKQLLEQTFAHLLDVVAREQLPIDGIEEVSALFKRKIANITASQTTAGISTREADADLEPTRTITAAHAVDIDTSSERSIKQTLLKVADFLAEMNEGSALSIRLRRYAVWLSITSLPQATHQGETQLMPMSVDRVTEYEEQLQRAANLPLWRQVEKSLALSPFWFDGHYISAQIAEKLGEASWALAIQEELGAFVQRLPGLLDLKFKGLVPFASEQTQQWLKGSLASGTDLQQGVGNWDEKRQEAMLLAQEGGLSVALAMLNDGLAQASEPRDQVYWRLLSADLMQANQLQAMAEQHYRSLLNQVSQMSVGQWEPSLIKHLEPYRSE
ncbi:type VI secretion system protein TssA [Celerinatantimonas yamalensis]|uniref:Type VI secretion system protein TssA n=1 Tax=Celerinatantimonas yamalensis TaxID=559956 RepID=A0ABW9G4D1_9GAMM